MRVGGFWDLMSPMGLRITILLLHSALRITILLLHGGWGAWGLNGTYGGHRGVGFSITAMFSYDRKICGCVNHHFITTHFEAIWAPPDVNHHFIITWRWGSLREKPALPLNLNLVPTRPTRWVWCQLLRISVFLWIFWKSSFVSAFCLGKVAGLLAITVFFQVTL